MYLIHTTFNRITKFFNEMSKETTKSKSRCLLKKTFPEFDSIQENVKRNYEIEKYETSIKNMLPEFRFNLRTLKN